MKVLMSFNEIMEVFPKSEMLASMLVFFIILIFSIIIKIKASKADPLVKPKGILLLAEIAVEKCDRFVEQNIGRLFVKRLSPYIGFVAVYIFFSFVIGLLGFSSPMTYYIVPFSLGLFTFLLIHITSAKYTKGAYFKRYVSPFVFFLPINLVSMWAPLISLSFRLFGNACAGWVLMELIYGVFEMISEALFGGLVLPLAAIVTPVLHAYFDIFSGFIQTLIFAYLSMLLIAGEVPDGIDVNDTNIEIN